MIYNEILNNVINEIALNKFNFAWLEAAPLYKVNRKNGSIMVLSKDDLITYETLTRAASGQFVRDAQGSSRVDYAIDSKGFEALVDYNDDVDAESKEREALAKCKAKIWTDIEVDFATLLDSTAISTSTVKNDWTGDYSDAYGHILSGVADFINETGFTPNTLILPYAEYMMLKSDSTVISKFPGAVAQTEALIRQNLAGLFGLEKVVISTARKKVSNSASFILPTGNFYLALSADNADTGLDVPAFARTLQWGINPYQVDVYEEKQITSNVYQANAFIKPVAFDTDFVRRYDSNTD